MEIHISKYTLYNAILRIARNFLETKENIKISTHPFYHVNLDWFSWEWSTKKIFFFGKKNPKWPFFKNGHFSKSPILKNFSRKFLRLVLGLVGLNDAEGIDVAQRIGLWGCPTKAQKQPKSTKKAFFGCFCFPMKISPNLYGRMDGSKFWCFPWFPENSLLCVILRYTVY